MADRVFADAAISEDDRLPTTLARWITKTQSKIVNLRKVQREARLPGLRKPDKVRIAVEALVEAHGLFPPVIAGPGRPREDYTVNPSLWEVL